MSVINTLDYLLPSKASLDVIGADGFSLNVQTFKIPAVYGYTATQATPLAMRPLPGNKMIYPRLEVSFIVTENLESWLEIHNWMRGLYAPERTEEYQNKKLYLQEIILTTYSSANNPLMRVRFHDAFPVTLEEIAFNVQEPSADPIKSKVEFEYIRFDIEVV